MYVKFFNVGKPELWEYRYWFISRQRAGKQVWGGCRMIAVSKQWLGNRCGNKFQGWDVQNSILHCLDINSLKTEVTSVTKGGTQMLPKTFSIVETYWHDHSLESSQGALSDDTLSFKIVKTYWHDHSLENSWGALSDGTINSLIQPFQGKWCIFWIFLK
jgi:hypothetical protein